LQVAQFLSFLAAEREDDDMPVVANAIDEYAPKNAIMTRSVLRLIGMSKAAAALR